MPHSKKRRPRLPRPLPYLKSKLRRLLKRHRTIDYTVRNPSRDLAVYPTGYRDYYWLICWGEDVDLGDTIVAETPETDLIELDVCDLRFVERWGSQAVHGIARLSRWNELTKFQRECEPIYPITELDLRNRLIAALVEEKGGAAFVEWPRLHSKAVPTALNLETYENGVKLVTRTGGNP